MRLRYFKVVDTEGITHGRFSGRTPKQAANKAFTSLCKTTVGGGLNGEIKFSIVESTSGSKRWKYNYVGKRLKLNNPIQVVMGGVMVQYKFVNRVYKDSNAEKNKYHKKKKQGRRTQGVEEPIQIFI